MIFRNLFPFLFCCMSFTSAMSQGIRGRITNIQNQPVPFANIYIPQLSSGTTTNIDGNYKLKLVEGKYKVIFQYLGYQTQTLELTIRGTFQEINISLIPQSYQIPEIKVMASGEDPAYYIMRRAIAMAPYYQKQVSKYSCKVYLKGSGVFEKIPYLLEKQMKKGGLMENQPFVMETLSKIEFELPDQVKQQVLAMRSSGKENNTSPMGMITNNLYGSDKYGIVSPVGKNALKVYRFILAGAFEDQGRTINKILVIPKINGSDVFSGFIYIADLYWNIHSADLNMHIPMTDVKVHQLYAEVNQNTWMPVSFDFDMDVSGFGLKMKYKYVASVSEYKTTLNPALDHSIMDKLKNQQIQEQQISDQIITDEKLDEQSKRKISKAQKQIDALSKQPKLTNHETIKLNRLIENESRRNSPPEPMEIKSNVKVTQRQVNNDSAYWSTLRPIPLTLAEKKSFIQKDSFLRISATHEYKDSVQNSKHKFKLKHLVFGKTYNYSIDSIGKEQRFSIPNLTDPTTLSFNSVDGLRVELPFNYILSDSSGHKLQIEPHFAYAFAREKLDASLSIGKRLNGMTNTLISAKIGTTTEDFNRITGLSAITNDLYTLWLEENYKRFYRRDFLQFIVSSDLANGLNLGVMVDYSDNRQLRNHSGFSIIKYKDRKIQPNDSVNSTLKPWQLGNHHSFVSHLVLEYTPRHRYRIQNGTKVYTESKFPSFKLEYKGAFANILRSDARFDLVELSIRQKINFGIDDHFSYSVNAGKFLNDKQVYFEDFQHFNTKPTGFMFSSYENSFRLLPFYQFSTRKQFLDMHGNWQSRRLILKQLPIIKNSLVSENIFINVLSTPELNNYIETGYGISNLFILLNLEAVAGFVDGRFRSAGIKVSLNIN